MRRLLISILVFAAAGSAAWANTTNFTPYVESFESYADGASLAATNGWYAGAGSTAVVTEVSYATNFSYLYPLNTNHSQVLRLSGSLTNRLVTPVGQRIWLDMVTPLNNSRIALAYGTNIYCELFATNSGMLTVRHLKLGGIPAERFTSLNRTVGTDEWMRVSVDMDMAQSDASGYHYFRMLFNGSQITNVNAATNSIGTGTGGPWFRTLQKNMTNITVLGLFSTNAVTYADDLTAGTNAPDFTPPTQATVTITATDPLAKELLFDPGTCTVTRVGGNSNLYLTVGYMAGGTAVAGEHYVALPGSVTIPPGVASADIRISPLNSLGEGSNTVVITLLSNMYCTVGVSSSATVTIECDDTSLNRRHKGPSSRTTGLIISEIMYNPAGTDGLEYVELYNIEPVTALIEGYRLSGDIAYEFPAGTVILPRSYVVVAADPDLLFQTYGVPDAYGPYSNRLGNAGGVVRLRNRNDALLLEVQYENDAPWPVVADGAGHSLTLIKPDYGEGDARAWGASGHKGGSPGSSDPYEASGYDGLVINEFVVHTDPPLEDSIELYNASSNSINIGGCRLSDDPGTNKYRIADGTVLGARCWTNFVQSQFGFGLNMAGGAIYLVSSNNTIVIDAVKYAAQSNGASCGRYPNGATGFQTLMSRTPGASNTPPRVGDIAINEIMYHTISENDDDQYVELYNRGTSSVNVGYWRFTAGMDYIIPPGTTIAPSNYLVIAKNVTNLLAKYAQLNTTNTLGNFQGALSHGGERLVLAKPDNLDAPYESYVIQDEVTYSDSWGDWTDGGGSSIELKDPRSDNRLDMNWAGSDESHKTTNLWTLVETNGTLALSRGANDEIQILLEDEGECLIDNVEVLLQGETSNRVANGGFEADTSGWSFNGNHIRTSRDTTEGYGSSASVHLRSSGLGNQGPNCIESDLSSSLSDGQVGVIRARIRWVAGTRRILLRFHNNGLEAPAALAVPSNLGTPGQRNSAYVTNAGPAISDVEYSPVLPGTGSNIVITARINDPDGITSVAAKWRNDTDAPSTTNTAGMNDGGTNGDVTAGDGIFSVRVAGLAVDKTMAFVVQAIDSNAAPATTRYPADAPTNECLVMFGQTDLGGTAPSYRFWITEATRIAWAARTDLSDEPNPGTFVYNNYRVVHCSWGRYRGSPFIRPMGNPESTICSSVLHAHKGEPVLGASSFNLDMLEDDNTKQREWLAVWMGEQIRIPFFYQRHTRYYLNEYQRTPIFGDSQSPNNRAYVESWFPDDASGPFHKIDDWFEFADGSGDLGSDGINARLERYESGGVLKKARYRWSWRQENPVDCNDDYSDLLKLVDALNLTPGTTAYDASLSALVDYEEWAHFSAFEHMICNWDTYTYNRGKNASIYKPVGGGWNLLMWDLDHSHFAGGISDSLFSCDDPAISGKFYTHPRFLRAYWRAYQNLVDGPMVATNCNPVMDQKYAWFVTNGISVTSPDSGLKTWIQDRRSYIITQLAGVTATFAITNNGGSDFVSPVNTVNLGGAAQVKIKTIRVNGQDYPDSFTSVTGWSIRLNLTNGANTFVVEGYDSYGQFVASDSITVTWSGSNPSPIGSLIINEIMYHSMVLNDDFVELRNLSTNTFCLDGFMLEGPDFTLGPGAFIGPTGYVVVAENRAVYAAAHTNVEVVVGAMGNGLDNGGDTLRLLAPSGGAWIVVDEVAYDDAAPWPAASDGSGPSLQLKDGSNDNNRVGNWAVDTNVLYTPGLPNSTATNLSAFDLVWINEIMPTNTAFADNMGEYEPWTELYNAGTNNIALGSGYYLSDSYTNLTKWAFPGGVTITNKTFLLVWADAETTETSNGWLHANWRISSTSGSVALARVSGTQTTIVDYVNYSGIGSNRSYGMYPNGTQYGHEVFHYPTPGTSNNAASDLPAVFINEWMAWNNSTTNDPVDYKFDDWIELYNASNSVVDLAGFQMAGSSNGTNRCTMPGGASIPGNGFMLVWANKDHTVKMVGANLYVNFGLSKDPGDTIWLFAPDGTVIDKVVFGPQLQDVGEGRWPDGAADIYQMPLLTPGRSNELFEIVTWQRSNDTAILQWRTRPQKQYRVEWSTAITNTAWNALPDITAISNMLGTNLVTEESWTSRFYRVHEVYQFD